MTLLRNCPRCGAVVLGAAGCPTCLILELRADCYLNNEIAARVGLTAQAVANRVWRARRRGLPVAATAYYPASRRTIEHHRIGGAR